MFPCLPVSYDLLSLRSVKCLACVGECFLELIAIGEVTVCSAAEIASPDL